ncbi:Peroxisomal 2,4-dienoyl-CoA reductase SPS19 [Saitozyma sp. JCM 24511]|nr:Peroxisomal 2,4-dienoyl-CoA reductase SPS19 [Saitozyma sp. JCM 24511]
MSKLQVPDGLETFQPEIFAGKVLFCTGGRSGIGYRIVEMMMKHGADAVIVGRDAKGVEESAAKLEASTGRRCLGASADVRDPEQLKKAVQAAKEKYGKLDFVVCGGLAPISGLSERAFRTVIEIDLIGTYNTIKATLPLLRETRGAYVHISATLHYRGTPWQTHVGAAKAGVDALSNALAVEEGPRGVRSNVVAPGPIGSTPGMTRLNPGDQPFENLIPLGRMGQTTDIANAVMFLFSPAASWINGSVMVVDGGDAHTRAPYVPYPEAMFNPKMMTDVLKGKL